MRFFLIILTLFIVTSCGYKPSSVYIKNMFDDDIYVEVNVDAVEPENAPFVKDEMLRLITTRMRGKILSKEEYYKRENSDANLTSKRVTKLTENRNQTNYILVDYHGSRFTPVSYDEGYVTRYRADIRVKFTMMTKDGKVSRSIRTRHEDDIQASSLASSALRTEAIRKGLEKALDQFLAYASAKGIMIHDNPSKKKKKIKVIQKTK